MTSNEDIPDPTDMSAFDKDVEEVDGMVNDKGEDSYDGYVNAELHLPQQDGSIQKGRVIKRVKGNDRKPLGTSHTNPLIDTSEYLIEMSDGSTDQYAANVIAENLFSQVDSEGRRFLVLSEITDHSADGRAIKQADGFTRSYNGNQVPKQTTIGWKLLVGWKDGSEEWIPLKNLKASNPIELAEYAVANNLGDEPAFKWWVAETLRKRQRIIGKIKSRYWVTTHKFGI